MASVPKEAAETQARQDSERAILREEAMRDLTRHKTSSKHPGRDYSLDVEVTTDTNPDGSTHEIYTEWYFTSSDEKKVARVMRHWREGGYCRWSFQFRPHPTHPRDNNNRHGLQIDNRICGDLGGNDVHPSLAVESALWDQARKTAIHWVTKKKILRGGLEGWKECGWREGMPMHSSCVSKGEL